MAKSGKNGVFFRRKNGVEYVLVRVPKLSRVSKKSKLLTRCKWYCDYVLPFFCSIFGDNFLELLKEYLVHTLGGKELLVDVIEQLKKDHQVATARKRPVRAGGGGDGVEVGGDDGSDTESASDDDDDSTDDSVEEDDAEQSAPPSESRQFAMIVSAAQRGVTNKRAPRSKASTRIPKNLLLVC